MLEAVILSADEPEVVTDVGVRVAVNPLGAAEDTSATLPENPLRALIVMVEEPEEPLLRFRVVGAAEIEKSGLVTCTVTVVVLMINPVVVSVPVIVNVLVPVGVPLGTLIFSVPEVVIGFGEKLAHPLVVVSVTESVNPLNGVSVMVDVPVDPALMLVDVGEAERVKYGLMI